MKYNIFGYLIGEGFGNVFKNKKSTGASLMIMCATMIIFGIFLILGENINHFVDQVKSEQGFQVFLNTDATEEEIVETGEKIRALNGVNTAERKTKEDALNIMKERLKDKDNVLDGFNIKRFSESYVVTLTDLNKSKEVQNEIWNLGNIKKITSSDETVTTLINLANGIRIVTGVILLLLIFISIFIISNTIKLTVHARRKEISIMKYVGATNSFIRWPFLVEGVIIGIISGLLSVAIIGGAYTGIANQLANTSFLQMANWKLLNFSDMFNLILVVYLGLGIGIGILGSTISMRKYLQV